MLDEELLAEAADMIAAELINTKGRGYLQSVDLNSKIVEGNELFHLITKTNVFKYIADTAADIIDAVANDR